MRRYSSWLIIFYAIIASIFSIIGLFSLLSSDFLNYLNLALLLLKKSTWLNLFSALFFASLLIGSIYLIILNFQTKRMAQTRLRVNDNGVIDIDVYAIENIALNSAKTSQAGIKTAKARVYSDQSKGITVEMLVHLYSDIEIPTQMAKIQERVKKDIERFTGIPVTEVSVRVLRIELLGVRVENS